MTITTHNGLMAATKTQVIWMKTGTRTIVGAAPYNLDGVTGVPTGTLAIGNTAAGVVPTDDGAYGPLLPAISNTAYISKIWYGSSVACTMILYDRLWAAGAYAYNTDTSPSSQPDFDGRIPSADTGLEIWAEAVTAFTGTPSVQVNYLDQGGNAGDTTAIACPVTTPPIGRMWRLPLASGDVGVYGIDGITRIRGSVASGGTFNVSVMRPLAVMRVPVANFYGVLDYIQLGLPRIYATSCLWVCMLADSTAVGLPYMCIEIADG
jgi:hypothetical protein